ncbi:MAG: LLM class flavin-dependent oxidoreductase [Actinomycetota bacterium]|nr:LLM class flavin-dependent oxidoreductase [Actinomycetota bacterium]
MKRLLFGVNVSTSAAPEANPVADAMRAEALGYDFISANDHPCGTQPSYELWTMLTWIAAKTTRIKVASRVLGVPYRPPAMVAKMAESLDRLSGGRLILGLGGGYSDEEFRAFGLNVPVPKDKIDGLEEAVRIIRGLWGTPSFTFEGKHHHTQDAQLEPKPAHQIPIWLGTFGKRSLAVTGRVADGWIPTFSMASPEIVPAMRDRIFEAAHTAGRDTNEITLAYNLDFRIQETAFSEPGVVTGLPQQMAEQLLSFVALGFTAMNFSPAGDEPERQVERLAQEVLPIVRSSTEDREPSPSAAKTSLSPQAGSV